MIRSTFFRRILPVLTPRLDPMAGVDEAKNATYFKYSAGDFADPTDLTRVDFDWLPRLDEWEHLCFVKKAERGKALKQLKFFVNSEPKGQGEE